MSDAAREATTNCCPCCGGGHDTEEEVCELQLQEESLPEDVLRLLSVDGVLSRGLQL